MTCNLFFRVVIILAFSFLFFTCKGRETREILTEDIITEIEIQEEQEEDLSLLVTEEKSEILVSYQVQRPLSSLSGLSGRLPQLGVYVQEINPVNYENPDIDIL